MKKKFFMFVLVFLSLDSVFCNAQQENQVSQNGVIKDIRDGQSYKIIKIGNQIWMAENLNFKTYNSVCYDNDPTNCMNYGRLYTWTAAMKACPEGWTLPTESDWRNLKESAELKGGPGNAGRVLKLGAFSALLGGDRINKKYNFLETNGYYWSSTEVDDTHAVDYVFLSESDDLVPGNAKYSHKEHGFSVRCIKSSFAVLKQEKKSSFVDKRDGKIYKTITIGNQTWMAENLNYKTLNSHCSKNDDSKCSKYGRLYDENEELCPVGWRLPTYEEVAALFDAVGGAFVYASDFDDAEGGMYFIWDAYTSEKLRLNSFIDNVGGSFHMGDDYRWSCSGDCSITTSNLFTDDAYVRCIKNDLDNYRNKNKQDKGVGENHSPSSVIFSSSPVSAKDVVVGSFTDGRDGHTYKSVKIGTQTWMAEDLKYKGGYYSWPEAVGFSANTCGTHHVCGLRGSVKGVCPKGWHLPSKNDFETLIAAAGGMTKAAFVLMSDSIDWSEFCDDFARFTNDYGFSAVPNGYVNYFGKEKNDGTTYFWSSTEENGNTAYGVYMGIDNVYYSCNRPPEIGVVRQVKYNRYSVRCLKD